MVLDNPKSPAPEKPNRMHAKPEPATPTLPYAVQLPETDYDAQGVRLGAWSAGLWQCTQHCIPNGLTAAIVPWISMAQISSRLELCSFRKAALSLSAIALLQYFTVLLARSNSVDYEGSDDDTIWVTDVKGSSQFKGHGYDSRHRAMEADASVANGTRAFLSSPWGVLNLLLGLVLVCVTWRLRMVTRKRYQIPGSACQDALASLCCQCCTLAQIATHVKSYKPGQCDFGPPPVDVLPGYYHEVSTPNVVVLEVSGTDPAQEKAQRV